MTGTPRIRGWRAPAAAVDFRSAYTLDVPYPPSRAEPERHIDTGDHRIDTSLRDRAPASANNTPQALVSPADATWWFGVEEASPEVDHFRTHRPDGGHSVPGHSDETAHPVPAVPLTSVSGTGFEPLPPPVHDAGPSLGIHGGTRAALAGPEAFLAGHWTGTRSERRLFRWWPKNKPRLRGMPVRSYETGSTPSPLGARGPKTNLRTSPFDPTRKTRKAGTARPTVQHTQEPFGAADTPPRSGDTGPVIGSQWVS